MIVESIKILTGSIFIHGHVGGCTLNAGENITIDEDTNTISAAGGGRPTYDEANQRLVF